MGQLDPSLAVTMTETETATPAVAAAAAITAAPTVADIGNEEATQASPQDINDGEGAQDASGEAAGRRRRGRRGGRRRRRGNGEAGAAGDNAQGDAGEQDEAMPGEVALAQRSQPEFDFDDDDTSPPQAVVAAPRAVEPAPQAVEPVAQVIESAPVMQVGNVEPNFAVEVEPVVAALRAPTPGLFDAMPTPAVPTDGEGEEQHSA